VEILMDSHGWDLLVLAWRADLVLRAIFLVRGRLVDENERPLSGWVIVFDGCNSDVGRLAPSLRPELVSLPFGSPFARGGIAHGL
jgi:hypothetical protein